MTSMTKEGKILIGVVLCLIAVAIIVPANSEKSENNSAKLTQAAENVASNEEDLKPKSNKSLEINGLKIVDQNPKIKNPFTFSHETQDEEPSNNDVKPKIKPESNAKILRNDNTPVKNQKVNKIKKDTPKAEWKLTGVVIVGESKTAILSREKETKTLSVGDSFDDKIITDISENYILYKNSGGQGRLDLSLH